MWSVRSGSFSVGSRFSLDVVSMNANESMKQANAEPWRNEIEHAIDNVKRTQQDKWLRREWYRAAARRNWTPERKAKWTDWREKHPRPEGRDESHQALAQKSKVWVKGHVPREFLDWVERHWSHDNETRAVLGECFFAVWERGG
jgi:hypothetical protein